MFLAVRQGSNKGSSQIDPRDREFSASKWVTMGTVKAELCKIANILKKDLHWLTRVGQKPNNKEDSKQKWQDLMNQVTRRLRRNWGLYFKSGKDTSISSNSKTLNEYILQTFTREIPDGIHQKEGHLEMTKN